MEKKIAALKSMLNDISDLGQAIGLLGWEQQTYMPPGAAESRGNQQALLGRLAQEWATSPKLGKLLDELKPYGDWGGRGSH